MAKLHKPTYNAYGVYYFWLSFCNNVYLFNFTFYVMRIVLYFFNWNDSFYIPFIHRYYGQFCERIVMLDQNSTDGSQELALSLGMEVRNRPGNTINDEDYITWKNDRPDKLGRTEPLSWKECRGTGVDYVIVCDADEFLVIPESLYSTLPAVHGYNMISEKLPQQDIFELNMGAPSIEYSKQIIFNPERIQEINYVHGAHIAKPVGEITVGTQDVCSLYHYRMIGGVERVINRHADYRPRVSKFNRDHKMAFHYDHSDAAKRDEWNFLKQEARELW